MKIVIAGGSGFIGRKLADLLIEEGFEFLFPTLELALENLLTKSK
ncbi:hypothetical protein [Metallumcola ferriviriculae]